MYIYIDTSLYIHPVLSAYNTSLDNVHRHTGPTVSAPGKPRLDLKGDGRWSDAQPAEQLAPVWGNLREVATKTGWWFGTCFIFP